MQRERYTHTHTHTHTYIHTSNMKDDHSPTHTLSLTHTPLVASLMRGGAIGPHLLDEHACEPSAVDTTRYL